MFFVVVLSSHNAMIKDIYFSLGVCWKASQTRYDLSLTRHPSNSTWPRLPIS